MIFRDLYEYAASIEASKVSVKDLARRIVSHHEEVGEITFTPVVLDENTTLGYVVYDYDRSSAYDDEFKIMGVRFSVDLNRCHRRFVCCKETMHAFDSDSEQTSSRDRYYTLMRELETTPLPENMSPMLTSENKAEWMALLVLCPKPRRDDLKRRMEASGLTPRQVAEEIVIPEWAVHGLMGEFYDDAYEQLIRRVTDRAEVDA